MTELIIRPLESSEWEMFRDFRLSALRAAPGVFSGRYEDSLARRPEKWQAMIGGDDHQVFGLFDGRVLVGITAVFQSDGDATGASAMLAMSFILPAYRGRQLSRLFYETRLAWVRARPRFRRVLVSARASNAASRRAIERYGFIETGRVPRVWPDSTTEDEILFELQI
jgi:RimJ/RimL family protein N-acetyltransferase